MESASREGNDLDRSREGARLVTEGEEEPTSTDVDMALTVGDYASCPLTTVQYATMPTPKSVSFRYCLN